MKRNSNGDVIIHLLKPPATKGDFETIACGYEVGSTLEWSRDQKEVTCPSCRAGRMPPRKQKKVRR